MSSVSVGKERIKVLYIAGWGRSGSTILGNILGQLDGYFSAGELRHIWERSMIENRKCGCGRPFSECETWREIIGRILPCPSKIRADELVVATYEYTRTRRVLPLGNRTADQSCLKYAEYLAVIENLYQSIASVTNSKVIIDSSKFPMYGNLLRQIPSLDVYIIHLIRDPRAVAYSWSIPKDILDGRPTESMPVIQPTNSSLKWMGWNMVIKYLFGASNKYYPLRYKDFINDPKARILEIVEMLGEKVTDLPVQGNNNVCLERTHTISGNPNRFATGNITLKIDNRWIKKMRRFDKLLVTTLTLPLLTHYDYPVLT